MKKLHNSTDCYAHDDDVNDRVAMTMTLAVNYFTVQSAQIFHIFIILDFCDFGDVPSSFHSSFALNKAANNTAARKVTISRLIFSDFGGEHFRKSTIMEELKISFVYSSTPYDIRIVYDAEVIVENVLVHFC